MNHKVPSKNELATFKDNSGSSVSFYRHELVAVVAHQVAVSSDFSKTPIWIEQESVRIFVYFLKEYGIEPERYFQTIEGEELLRLVYKIIMEVRSVIDQHFSEKDSSTILLTNRVYRPEQQKGVSQKDSFNDAEVGDGWWQV